MVELNPLEASDKEQFIKDNQEKKALYHLPFSEGRPAKLEKL